MKVQSTRAVVCAAAVVCCLTGGAVAPVQAQDPTFPPELVELFEQLGFEIDENGSPVPPPPPPVPTTPPAEVLDPLEFLASLGIPIDAVQEPPAPTVPEPVVPPTPVDPPTISPEEILFFEQLGLVIDENGNIVAPEPVEPVTPPNVIDTQTEAIEFFVLAGVPFELDENGVPVPAPPSHSAPTSAPMDPTELFISLGIVPPEELAPTADALSASPFNVPEPSTILLSVVAGAALFAARKKPAS